MLLTSNIQMSLKEDYLEVDPPIPGQNYVCLSFVSPEDMIRKKTLFECRKYLEHIISRTKTDAPNEHLTLEQALEKLTVDGYDDYAVSHEEENTKLFNEENDAKTSVRGIKVRGTFESLKEAQRKAKVLQTRDPTFHVFVGQVGYWLPWDPNPDNIANQEYSEQALNEIVKKYKENRAAKDEIWNKDLEKRIAATKAEGQLGAQQSSGIKEITEEGETNSDLTGGKELKAEESKKMIDGMFEGDDLFLARKKEQEKVEQ
jgi:hypothetical protein